MEREQERLVKKIAYSVFNTYCKVDTGYFTVEDLIHYGVIGLLTAQKQFNSKLGVPFNAYAAIRIKGEIMDAVRKSPLIRIPQKKRKLFNQLSTAKKEVMDQGKIPEIDELAAQLGWSAEKVVEVDTLFAPVIPIDAGFETLELSESQTGNHTEQKILEKDLAKLMQACIESIADARHRIVFIAREIKNMTLKQVGMKMGWTIEKTRQAQIRAKESMKSCLKKSGWGLE